MVSFIKELYIFDSITGIGISIWIILTAIKIYKESYDEINDNLRITWVSSEVNKAHWSAYFLNLQKIIDRCWESGTVVGPGRGSGVGFYLLYILDIIQINPLWETTRTFSWRFLNPDRVSVLD